MPRIRFKVGDTVAWDLAGFTFCGVVDRIQHGRSHGGRSVVLRFPADDYDRYGEALDRWGDRECAAGNPSPPVEFAAAWVYENLVEERGYFKFLLHTFALRKVDPDNLPSRERTPPDTIPVDDVAGRTLRFATAQDIDALTDVFMASWVAAHSEPLTDKQIAAKSAAIRESSVDMCKQMAEPVVHDMWGKPLRTQVLVCEEQGTVVGYSSYGMGKVCELIVHPDARKTGAGRALLVTALDGLRADKEPMADIQIPELFKSAEPFVLKAGFFKRTNTFNPGLVYYCRSLR
jgi:GNAT superfamily N-acetyltransferase